jgi:hypothetical protein
MKHFNTAVAKMIAFGGGVLMLVGCGNTMSVKFDYDFGKVYVNPDVGDTINFPDYVDFVPPDGKQCEQGGMHVKKCKLTPQMDGHIVAYHCSNPTPQKPCPDPIIPVGDSATDEQLFDRIFAFDLASGARATPPAETTYIYCDSASKDTLDPPSSSAAPLTANNGDILGWVGINGAEQPWTVTFDMPNVCDPNPVTNSNGKECKLSGSLTSGLSYTYKAHAMACTGSMSVTGYVKIN